MKRSAFSLLRSCRFWGCLLLALWALRLCFTLFDGDTQASFAVIPFVLGLYLFLKPAPKSPESTDHAT